MSSFAYLKHLPVDHLKIDGAFVRDIAHDAIDRAMVEAINKVGHVMGLTTIAECVETPLTLAILEEIGVDYAQGFAIARPHPYITTRELATEMAILDRAQSLGVFAGVLNGAK
jgi:EAL domain-containing protein (putative c-di-GMP-specific phosphodiesterase class I)